MMGTWGIHYKLDFQTLGFLNYLFNVCDIFQTFILHKSSITHFSLETPKRITGKQCRPISDATGCSI